VLSPASAAVSVTGGSASYLRARKHKKPYRLYREQGLVVRRRRVPQARDPDAGTHGAAAGTGPGWSIDFVSDCLAARRFRILVVVDYCTRERLAAVVDTWISGARVAQRAGHPGRPTRRPDEDRQRQWPGSDLTCDPGVDQPRRARLALHRARQAAAERLRREFDRPAGGTSS
jgi:hypothetical protein